MPATHQYFPEQPLCNGLKIVSKKKMINKDLQNEKNLLCCNFYKGLPVYRCINSKADLLSINS